ncbi:MAG: T9SS C-terminal target domain-containing protein [Calditrichaeota bacterium]|nr:MAG: T9SS C-terminal target domain-containing protein [Calditrichota bacterium]MBL1204468.1 T9SS C-terminal target domain-containing protein [Calditrichota bacterium]NOG44297.1 T9SS type A sorting domain-containing protein [Calditrichota bacterium]
MCKKFLVTMLLGFVSLTNLSAQAVIADINSHQIMDGTGRVSIKYRLSGIVGTGVTIKLIASLDGGVNFNTVPPDKYLKGDVGTDISNGNNEIIWDADSTFSQSNKLHENVKIKLIIEEQTLAQTITLELFEPIDSVWELPDTVTLSDYESPSQLFWGSNGKDERGSPLFSNSVDVGATFYPIKNVQGFPVKSDGPSWNRRGASSFYAQKDEKIWISASVGVWTTNGIDWQYQIRYQNSGTDSSMFIGYVPNSGFWTDPIEITEYKVTSSENISTPFVSAGFSIDLRKSLKHLNSYLSSINPKELTDTQFDDSPIKVCADGTSNISQFYYSGTLDDVSKADLKIVITENESIVDTVQNGRIHKVAFEEGNIIFHYKHPLQVPTDHLYNELTLKIVKISTQYTIYEYPVRVYRAPVVMVHGLWADRSTFEDLDNELKLSQWPNELTRNLGYEETNSHSFETNKDFVKGEVFSTILNAIEKKYSVGKVNLVVHSMGGILSRLYFQSDGYNADVCRFITLNTPHSGSQMGNFLIEALHGKGGAGLASVLFTALALSNQNPYNGAVEDLRVGSDAIFSLNDNITSQSIPKHVIVTNETLADTTNEPTGFVKVIFTVLFFIYTDVEQQVKDIFNYTLNDFIVPDSSQSGGIINETFLAGQWHSGSAANIKNISKVLFLLNQHPDNESFFTRDIFKPLEIHYNYKFNHGNSFQPVFSNTIANSSDSISITYPSNGSSFSPGMKLDVSVSGTDNIIKSISIIGSETSQGFTHIIDSANGVFQYTIPDDAFGVFKLVTFGIDNNENLYQDSVLFNVNFDADLDSIKINPRKIFSLESNLFQLNVQGFYSDGIRRNIAKLSDLKYEFADSSLLHDSPGLFKGVYPDTTKIFVSIGQIKDSIEVVILPKDIFVGINDNNSKLNQIVKYELIQNYPNPFNPITTISYNLPKADDVKIEIFDITGRRVKELSHGKQTAGTHSLQFDGSDLASGLYILKLQAGRYIASKKMLLIK